MAKSATMRVETVDIPQLADMYLILHNAGSIGSSYANMEEVQRERPWYCTAVQLGLTFRVEDKDGKPKMGYVPKYELGRTVHEQLLRMAADPDKLRYVNQHPQFSTEFSDEHRGKAMTHLLSVQVELLENLRKLLVG